MLLPPLLLFIIDDLLLDRLLLWSLLFPLPPPPPPPPIPLPFPCRLKLVVVLMLEDNIAGSCGKMKSEKHPNCDKSPRFIMDDKAPELRCSGAGSDLAVDTSCCWLLCWCDREAFFFCFEGTGALLLLLLLRLLLLILEFPKETVLILLCLKSLGRTYILPLPMGTCDACCCLGGN